MKDREESRRESILREFREDPRCRLMILIDIHRERSIGRFDHASYYEEILCQLENGNVIEGGSYRAKGIDGPPAYPNEGIDLLSFLFAAVAQRAGQGTQELN